MRLWFSQCSHVFVAFPQRNFRVIPRPERPGTRGIRPPEECLKSGKCPKEKRMKRRDFLKVSAAGAAATAVASPAIAQSSPEIKWRLTSSFPKSLDTIYGGAEQVSKYVAEMTDNKFQIQVFAAGELAPGLQALDATSNGTVEMCHTVSYYYVGKDPTFSIYASVPFGLNARQQNSWWYQGGGMELGNEFFKKFGVIGFPCGNTGMNERYDMLNPSALKRLVAGGTQLRPFTNEVLEACLKATNELWAEISGKNADFKKSVDAMQAYRSDQYLWWQVAEYTFDSFMIRSRTRG